VAVGIQVVEDQVKGIGSREVRGWERGSAGESRLSSRQHLGRAGMAISTWCGMPGSRRTARTDVRRMSILTGHRRHSGGGGG
jgi:hypothetical protein